MIVPASNRGYGEQSILFRRYKTQANRFLESRHRLVVRMDERSHSPSPLIISSSPIGPRSSTNAEFALPNAPPKLVSGSWESLVNVTNISRGSLLSSAALD